MPTTPDEWLPVLAKRLDSRQARIRLQRSYAGGNAPLPEMGENLRASWEAFQRKARTDYGGAAVRSLLNREKPNGVRIGDSEDSEALTSARRIWRDNRLDVVFGDAIRDFIETAYGYVVVGVDDAGEAVVTREKPEQFIAAQDPVRPWKARATLKVWRDMDAELDFVHVVAMGAWATWERPARTSFGRWAVGVGGSGWVKIAQGTYAGEPTVAILEREDGVAFLEPHFDVIDRLNLGKLNRLVIVAMQAFRQRALRPKDNDSGGLPDKDADGNDIDWAKALEPAPGALWEFPVPIDIWESVPTDITPLLAGEKTDARDFAMATGTPISALIPEGENQSAEGAANAKEQQIAQADRDVARLKPGLALALVYALRAERVDLGGDTVEVMFAPTAHVSLTERYAAAVQAKGVGRSFRGIATDILGMTPDQIAQEMLDKAEEQLTAITLVGAAAAAPQPQPVVSGAEPVA